MEHIGGNKPSRRVCSNLRIGDDQRRVSLKVSNERRAVLRQLKRLARPKELANVPNMRQSQPACGDPAFGNEKCIGMNQISPVAPSELRHLRRRPPSPTRSKNLAQFQERSFPPSGAYFSVPPIERQEQDFTASRPAELLALRPGAGIMTDRAGCNPATAEHRDQPQRAQGRAPRGAVENVQHFSRLAGRCGQGTSTALTEAFALDRLLGSG